MKLIFDQNLSPKLTSILKDLFEDCLHVQTVNLGSEDDSAVWLFAKKENYIIVTKDADFSELASFYGFPPRVIWIRMGNCSTKAVEKLLRKHYQEILNLSQDDKIGTLIIP